MPMSVVYATVNGRMVQENRGGTITKYVADTLGSVIQTRNASGVQTSSTTYWPYGEVRTSTGTNPSPWGFVGTLGYFRDALTRLYIRARYYIASIGRWNSVDPLWPNQDPFSYVASKPVSISDPLGLLVGGCFDTWIGVGPYGFWSKCCFLGSPFTHICFPIPGGKNGRVYPPESQEWTDIYWYGNYCGANNVKDPGCQHQFPPVDCVDAACQKHDNCLDACQAKFGAGSYFTHCGALCHCALHADSKQCLIGGCITHHERIGGIPFLGDGLGIGNCNQAAITVGTPFGPICLGTGISGFFKRPS